MEILSIYYPTLSSTIKCQWISSLYAFVCETVHVSPFPILYAITIAAYFYFSECNLVHFSLDM